jgi:replicative DNA helicase
MLKLPSAIYAERYLLGVVIRDGLDIKDLSPAEFYEPIHQEIAFCVKQINEQGNHPDELVILNALRANNSVVQAHYINELTSEVKESRLNQAWSDEIKRTAALRAIAINAEHVQRLATDPNADPESLIAYNEGTLKSLVKRD